jgi:hypothetical protein
MAEIETLSKPYPECRGCGKPITQRPHLYVEVRRVMPRNEAGKSLSPRIAGGDYHEGCAGWLS